jgi:hypothetical protein
MTRASAALASLLLVGACAQSPVAWTEVEAVVPAARGAELRLVADSSGGRIVTERPEATPPAATGACPGSVRFARADTGRLYAVWWQPRADSSVALVSSYSGDDAQGWSNPVPVDTVDRGVAGCARPAPSVSASGAYVHVAFSLQGPEGTGLFHAPVPIVYGDRLTEASVAADGDRVVVAYVDPNTSPSQLGLAISHSMGHLFDERVRVTASNGSVSAPLVGVANDLIAVSWEIPGPSDSLGFTRVLRTGRIR